LGIDRRKLPHSPPHTGERRQHRAVLLVQGGIAFLAQQLDPFRAREHLPGGAQFLVFARLRCGLLDFGQLEGDEIQPRRFLAPIHA
jgi:hypothetical protein